MDSLTIQLEQLEAADLVHRLPEQDLAYLFKHSLMQETAYESLLIKKRREVHRRVAEAYEQVYPDRLDEYAAVLAAHYAQAGEDAKLFPYAIRAGDLAANISAYTEARAHYTDALEALSRLPDTEQNRRARVDTTVKQMNVVWGLDTAEQNLVRLFQAEALARTLPEQDRSGLARIHYWIGRVYSYRNEHRQAASYYEQVLKAARESEDPELFGLASALGGRAAFLRGYFGQAVPLLTQAIPLLERTGNWQEWILAQVSLAIALGGQGHYHEGRRHGEEALERALMLNDQTSIASARGMTARVEFMAGDLERMLDEIRQTVKEAETANPLVMYMVRGFQAWAESRLGMHDAARATMAAANSIATQFGTRLIFGDWFAAARAEVELNAGQTEAALRLAEEAVSEAQTAGGIFSEGIAQRVWGQALAAVNGPGDRQADAHFEKSLKLFQEGEAVIEAARTHVAWGRVLQARGEWHLARTHFQDAAAQFQASGLGRELNQTNFLVDSLPT